MVDLSNSTFVKTAYFGGVFEAGVTFEGATFEKAVHFYNLTARTVDFTNARITGLFEANNANFNSSRPSAELNSREMQLL